ncbi:MAG: hypothetical protein ACYCSN_09430 [Acidobacteriaceae bacterium]
MSKPHSSMQRNGGHIQERGHVGRAHVFLCMLANNITHTHLNPEAKIFVTMRPTPLQAKAFKLLGLNHACA